MNTQRGKNPLNPSVTRRTFLKVSGALASGAAVTSPVFTQSKAVAASPPPPPPPDAGVYGEYDPDAIETEADIMYTVCQMCHSRCGVRAKVQGGILVKLDGNPYHPNNRDVRGEYDDSGNWISFNDRLPYGKPPGEAWKELGRMCLKGQAGLQTVYDPFRLQHPLKQMGPRNSGQWATITWEQAFFEIAEKINALIPPGERNELIDGRPELGPKRNQLAFAPGRSVEKEMSERIWKHAWGTVNYGLSHTSICESTRHVANELITWEPGPDGKNSMGAGRTEGWQADILGAEFLIYFGANPLEADFPMVGMARNLMEFKRAGGKYVCVDPRMNNTGAKANWTDRDGPKGWVPINPGTDAALAMGMILKIIPMILVSDKKNYLENTNAAAALADGEPTWTDATYLVGTFTDDNKQFQRYITAQEAGIADGATVMDDDYVVWSEGGLKGYNAVQQAALEFSETVDLTIDGSSESVEVKSAFTLLRESAESKSLFDYAQICGVDMKVIEDLAIEFVLHGKKAAAITYRGPIKHTNGFYNQLAIQHLNTLIGNYDWKGGCTAGAGGWNHKSGVVSLSTVDGDPVAKGLRIDRAKTFYNTEEAGSLFTGYPAQRPWFPFATHGNYQEVIPSVADGYPYPLKVLITYWNAWPYSTPALRKTWEKTVADESKLPLLVSISPVMGEVAAWADYVLPDTTYLEKYSVPGIPWRVNKGTSFQQPVVGDNWDCPACPDTKPVLDIHIELAKALNLPGVGEDALLDDGGAPVGHLNNSLDWANAMLDNIYKDYSGMKPSEESRANILSKGGVFDNPGDEYDEEQQQLSYQYGNIIRMFADPVAQTKDSVTGEYYSGVPHYKPIAHSDGTLVNDGGDFPFRLITYKTVHHGQARTNVNPWLMLMIPENPVEISAIDAANLEIETGDEVKITSASKGKKEIKGRALVTQRLKPGVIAISHHYGHWEQNSQAHHMVDGVVMGHDPSRAAGLQPSQIMRTDKLYENVSLQEPIGASCSFYDTWVKVEK